MTLRRRSRYKLFIALKHRRWKINKFPPPEWRTSNEPVKLRFYSLLPAMLIALRVSDQKTSKEAKRNRYLLAELQYGSGQQAERVWSPTKSSPNEPGLLFSDSWEQQAMESGRSHRFKTLEVTEVAKFWRTWACLVSGWRHYSEYQ